VKKILFNSIVKTSAIFIWILILIGVFVTLKNIQPEKNKKPLVLDKINDIGSNPTQDRVINTYVNWRDSRNFYYSANLKISYYDYLKSIRNRDRSNKEYLNGLYVDIVKSDYYDLDRVYSALDFIRKDRSLSKKKFAEIVVAMVQHIPYSYVVERTCREEALNDSSMYNDISNGTECEGLIYGGVYTPLEFIRKKKGDCDSRTLLIFTILRYFGYDVVILNSDLYAHSVIGLNIPYSGLYKYYRGRRYYTWETTTTGYDLGMLHPSDSDINYWYVALQ
jgi:hypothetical protein